MNTQILSKLNSFTKKRLYEISGILIIIANILRQLGQKYLSKYDLNIKTLKPNLYTTMGGLSGPAIKPIAIANIYKKAEEHNCKILIPEDCMVGTDFEGAGKNKNLGEIQENEIILDIGPKTIKHIQDIIVKIHQIQFSFLL